MEIRYENRCPIVANPRSTAAAAQAADLTARQCLTDSGGFSIETTTMRLKSLRLRRAEAETRKWTTR